MELINQPADTSASTTENAAQRRSDLNNQSRSKTHGGITVGSS
jgi:hypothetical protein